MIPPKYVKKWNATEELPWNGKQKNYRGLYQFYSHEPLILMLLQSPNVRSAYIVGVLYLISEQMQQNDIS